MPIIYDLSRLAPDTRKLIEKSRKFRKWFSEKPDSMLRLDGSTKVIKGNKLGYRTAILYLAPANMSGNNVCPMAKTAACADACLNTSGRGAMTGVQMSRLRKTLFWLQFQDEAIALINTRLRRLRQGPKSKVGFYWSDSMARRTFDGRITVSSNRSQPFNSMIIRS